MEGGIFKILKNKWMWYGVLDFMKRSSYVEMKKNSAYELEKYVSQMAEIEKLDGHKLSVKIRQKQKK